MAEALPVRSAKLCINCAIYDWKQPEDQSVLKRCTGCRVVWYCGKDCQKEHWYNSHKNDCKYLARKKVLSNAVHDEATCLVCKEEARVGQVQMSRLSNPALPCVMSKSNMRLMNIKEEQPLTITLAEMTGQFHTNLEATVTIMMRIMVKMKMSKPELWQMPSAAATLMIDLYKTLFSMRKDIKRNIMLCKKPGPLQGQLLFDSPPSENDIDTFDAEMMFNVLKLIRDFGEQFSSVFKPLETLSVLLAIFLEGYNNISRFVVDCVGINGISEKVGKVRMTYAQFNKMWKNVINMLKEGLVPFEDLVVKGLCDGNPTRQCYVCEDEIIVKYGAWIYSFSPDPAVIIDRSVVYYLCGNDSCKDSKSSLSKEVKEIGEQYSLLAWEHRYEICDYCGQLNQELRGHRCAGCLTKVYCGLGCLRSDTNHLMVCKKGDDRKKKRGKDKRKEKGRQERIDI